MRSAYNFEVDGQTIFGVWERPDDEGAGHPAVLILHGIAGTKVEPHRLFVLMGEALARRGIASLRFDFRGAGDSEGSFAEVTFSSMLRDAAVAARHLAQGLGVDDRRLGLLGLSLGGALAASLTAVDERFKALALWAPMAEFVPDWFQGLYDDLSTKGVADMAGDPVSAEFVEELRRCRPLDAIHAFRKDAMVVHGTADAIVPLSHGEAYVGALKAGARSVTWLPIAGADHTFNSIPWSEQVIEKTADWLADVL